MTSKTPVSLDYAQVASTADEETAAILAAIDFRKSVSHLVDSDSAASRIAEMLPAVFIDHYGRSSCTGKCVTCSQPTADVLTVGWQCDLVTWTLARFRYVNVESACSLCLRCADRLAARIEWANRLIWIGLVSAGLLAVLAWCLRSGWVAALLASIAVAIAFTRYGTLKSVLPDVVVSRFPNWVRWVAIRGFTSAGYPLNRLRMDFSKPESDIAMK